MLDQSLQEAADAGQDVGICDEEFLQLTGNLPPGTTGTWTSLEENSTAFIEKKFKQQIAEMEQQISSLEKERDGWEKRYKKEWNKEKHHEQTTVINTPCMVYFKSITLIVQRHIGQEAMHLDTGTLHNITK